MGRQVLSDRESLPAWQMGTDKRFQYDFIKRTQGMPGPGQHTCLAHRWFCFARDRLRPRLLVQSHQRGYRIREGSAVALLCFASLLRLELLWCPPPVLDPVPISCTHSSTSLLYVCLCSLTPDMLHHPDINWGANRQKLYLCESSQIGIHFLQGKVLKRIRSRQCMYNHIT